MRTIIVEETGGPQQLLLREVPEPTPKEGQVAVQVAAAGINYIDTYHRSGQYPLPLPFTPGLEGAGVVTGVGEGVTGVKLGDQVAWSSVAGSYADTLIADVDRLAIVPPNVELNVAAAVMLQGLTAHYLCTSVYPVKEGDWTLVHAAAGGVGLLLTQLIKLRGGHVLGTASTSDKRELALQNGADAVCDYESFLEDALELTEGKGVHVAFDGVGADTFADSMQSLRPRGMMALFGQSSGPVEPFDPQSLSKGGSLFLTRPTLAHYIAEPAEFVWRTGELFELLQSGNLNVRIGAQYQLEQAAQAHLDLESRKITGKALLHP